MKPLVSILVPAYNADQYLARTLESLLAQTWANKEIIVVNDGSRDRTLEIAHSFESRGIRVHNHANMGQSATFNVAYGMCHGDYISFFDADDLMTPDKIERQMEYFLGGDNDDTMATCEWARFYNEPEEAVFKTQYLWRDMKPTDWLVHAWQNHQMMHGATWLIPRKVLNKSGLWNQDLSLINDHEFFCRAMLTTRLIKFVPGVRTYYRSWVPGNLSGIKGRKAWVSAYTALTLSTDELLKAEDSSRVRQACATKLQRFIYEIYPEDADLASAAAKRAYELGGSDVVPMGGALFNLCRHVFGWKIAKRAQRQVYRRGYLRHRLEQLRKKAQDGALPKQ